MQLRPDRSPPFAVLIASAASPLVRCLTGLGVPWALAVWIAQLTGAVVSWREAGSDRA